MVESLVVGVLINPFGRLMRAEYRYRSAYTEACHPIAPLIDDLYLDGRGLLLVPDVYSVWPDAQVFPRATSYREVVEGVLVAVERRCASILSPRLCRNVEFRVIPWTGTWGGWEFNAVYGDVVALSFYHILDAVLKLRPRKIQLVLNDALPALLGMAVYEALCAAIKAVRNLGGLDLPEPEILAQEPFPYPWTRRKAPLLELLNVPTLMELGPPPASAPCKPLKARVRTPESMAFERRVPRLEAVRSLEDLLSLMKSLVDEYIDLTLIRKEKVGGKLVHTVSFDFHCIACSFLKAELRW